MLKQAKTSFFSRKKGFVATIFNPFCTGCCAGLDQEKQIKQLYDILLYIFINLYTTLYHHVYPSCCIIDDWIKTFVGIGIRLS